MDAQKLRTSSLDEIVPAIAFFPRLQLASLCGVGGSTLDRYRNDLIEVKVSRFEWQFYGGGYDRESAECMWQYAQLVKMMRLAIAKQNIKQHMEEFWYDREKNR